jgi:hypothetical protein
MMAAVRTSEPSVIFYETARRNISEDGHLQTRRRENLKPHNAIMYYVRYVDDILIIYDNKHNSTENKEVEFNKVRTYLEYTTTME